MWERLAFAPSQRCIDHRIGRWTVRQELDDSLVVDLLNKSCAYTTPPKFSKAELAIIGGEFIAVASETAEQLQLQTYATFMYLELPPKYGGAFSHTCLVIPWG